MHRRAYRTLYLKLKPVLAQREKELAVKDARIGKLEEALENVQNRKCFQSMLHAKIESHVICACMDDGIAKILGMSREVAKVGNKNQEVTA